MILTVFLVVLLGLIALGMPIAFALIISAIVMMFQLDFYDTQLLAQNMLSGATSRAAWVMWPFSPACCWHRCRARP